jgi:Carboxypeptidase regulatory-like domain/Tetratricopeptide repeat
MLRLPRLTLAFLLLCAPVFAQGHVFGTVRDEDGKPVKGASVTAENPDVVPSAYTSTTDAKGRFGMLGLRGGTWTIVVQAPGFEVARTKLTTKSLGPVPALDVRVQRAVDAPPPGPLANIDTNTLQQKLDTAAALESAGKVDEAIAAYREIQTRVPGLTTVHLALGVLYERKDDPAGALAEYRAVLKSDPSNTRATAAISRLEARTPADGKR